MNKCCLIACIILTIGLITPLYSTAAETTEGLNKPQWTAGDYWSYDINVDNITASDYTFEVRGKETITQNNQSYEVYAMHITGSIIITTLHSTTHSIEGTTYYTVDNLAIVKSVSTETTTIDSPPQNDVTYSETIYLTPYDNMQFPINIGETWHAQSQVMIKTTTNGNMTTNNHPIADDFTCTELKTITIENKSYETYVIRNGHVTDSSYTLIYVSSTVGYIVQQNTYNSRDGLKTLLTLKSYKYSAGETGFLGETLGGIPVIIPIIIIIFVIVVIVIVAVVMKRRKKAVVQTVQPIPVQATPQPQYVVQLASTQVIPASVIQKEFCAQCAKEISPEFVSCPYCGAALPRPSVCPKCGKKVETEYNICPYCQENLKKSSVCTKCGKELEPEYMVCPYCGTKN